jgi:nicotinic acid mononucleotide adenylyltransferase
MGDILVFGLSSDPIHSGHVELVTSGVVQLLGRGYHVNEVILAPTGFPHPTKQASATSFTHRSAMCRLGSEEIARALSGSKMHIHRTSDAGSAPSSRTELYHRDPACSCGVAIALARLGGSSGHSVHALDGFRSF